MSPSRHDLHKEPLRTPYGTYVEFVVHPDHRLAVEEGVSILGLWKSIVTLTLAPEQPLGREKDHRRYRLVIEGFASACEAGTKILNLTSVEDVILDDKERARGGG